MPQDRPLNRRLLPLVALAAANAAPAGASEIFGGVYIHDEKTILNRSGFEDGTDVQLGWRGERIAALGVLGRPSPYALVVVNTAGDTSYAAAGLNLKFGDPLYFRPGLGLAVHDGPESRPLNRANQRIRFGSRILLAPEIGLGYRFGERVSAELSWTHFSHGYLLDKRNPGTDNFGVRVNFRY